MSYYESNLNININNEMYRNMDVDKAGQQGHAEGAKDEKIIWHKCIDFLLK